MWPCICTIPYYPSSDAVKEGLTFKLLWTKDSCPTCPKPSEVDVSERDVGTATIDREISRGQPGGQNGGVAERGVSAAGTRPYGSWMIVTRKERRQQGRPAGHGRQAETLAPGTSGGRQKEIPNGNGSRFAMLGNDDVTEENVRHDENVNGGSPHGGMQPTTLGGRPRRANVIVNERQIQNEQHQVRTEQTPEKEGLTGRRQSGSGSRRAAEEDEHVVIRGEQGGQVISTTVVHNGDTAVADVPVTSQQTPEHHADPPEARDEEGDIIMDVESQPTALVVMYIVIV
nr:uncharacterized protein LOC109158503 [Ipomoea trifida]